MNVGKAFIEGMPSVEKNLRVEGILFSSRGEE